LRILSKETGDPGLIFVDETEPILANRDFAMNFVKVGLQEGRKARQAYILAFQRAEAIKQVGMSELIRGQCQTGFFFRNPTANASDYDEWDLNPAELDFIFGKEFQGYPYAVLVKKYATGESAILDINMSSLGRYFNAYQSGNTDIRVLRQMKEKHGDNFLDFYLDAAR
jgi:type IV secretory pathway VirB4 component